MRESEIKRERERESERGRPTNTDRSSEVNQLMMLDYSGHWQH